MTVKLYIVKHIFMYTWTNQTNYVTLIKDRYLQNIKTLKHITKDENEGYSICKRIFCKKINNSQSFQKFILISHAIP